MRPGAYCPKLANFDAPSPRRDPPERCAGASRPDPTLRALRRGGDPRSCGQPPRACRRRLSGGGGGEPAGTRNVRGTELPLHPFAEQRSALDSQLGALPRTRARRGGGPALRQLVHRPGAGGDPRRARPDRGPEGGACRSGGLPLRSPGSAADEVPRELPPGRAPQPRGLPFPCRCSRRARLRRGRARDPARRSRIRVRCDHRHPHGFLRIPGAWRYPPASVCRCIAITLCAPACPGPARRSLRCSGRAHAGEVLGDAAAARRALRLALHRPALPFPALLRHLRLLEGPPLESDCARDRARRRGGTRPRAIPRLGAGSPGDVITSILCRKPGEEMAPTTDHPSRRAAR